MHPGSVQVINKLRDTINAQGHCFHQFELITIVGSLWQARQRHTTEVHAHSCADQSLGTLREVMQTYMTQGWAYSCAGWSLTLLTMFV